MKTATLAEIVKDESVKILSEDSDFIITYDGKTHGLWIAKGFGIFARVEIVSFLSKILQEPRQTSSISN